MAAPTLIILLTACLLASTGSATVVSVEGQKWHINGEPVAKGSQAEGLLLNARLIQAIFDDSNVSTRQHWRCAYTRAPPPSIFDMAFGNAATTQRSSTSVVNGDVCARCCVLLVRHVNT